MSSTIEHVESSDDLELLEAEVETARARREEREAIERLARASCSLVCDVCAFVSQRCVDDFVGQVRGRGGSKRSHVSFVAVPRLGAWRAVLFGYPR